MWSAFVAGCLATLRRRLSLRARTWQWSHKSLVAVVVTGTVVHALLIEGTMEFFSKAILCLLVVVVTLLALFDFKFGSAVNKLQP